MLSMHDVVPSVTREDLAAMRECVGKPQLAAASDDKEAVALLQQLTRLSRHLVETWRAPDGQTVKVSVRDSKQEVVVRVGDMTDLRLADVKVVAESRLNQYGLNRTDLNVFVLTSDRLCDLRETTSELHARLASFGYLPAPPMRLVSNPLKDQGHETDVHQLAYA